MLVHITFHDNHTDSTLSKKASLNAVLEITGPTTFDSKWFHKYGLLTIEVQEGHIESIRQLECVESVSEDGIKKGNNRQGTY